MIRYYFNAIMFFQYFILEKNSKTKMSEKKKQNKNFLLFFFLGKMCKFVEKKKFFLIFAHIF